LWQRHQGELVGIATGTVSNLAVLDIDAKHAEARAWWDGHRTQLPPTRTIRTRSGGLHLWYRHVPGLRCSASLIAPGVDVRATGGYVIAWHVAGLPLLRETSLPPWPDWLRPEQSVAVPRVLEPPRVPDDKQIAALVRFVASAPEKQRNNRLFWAACRMAAMVGPGLLAKKTAEELLVHAATHAGLPEIEARRTARSGFTTGRAG
jgi:Bifunctional DNA primase/polymerase, N-terminal